VSNFEMDIKKGNPFENSYIKGEVLGVGGFGHVFSCSNRITGVLYAIKVSSSSMGKEFAFGDLCRHQHILSPIELWFDGSVYFLVMPQILPASKLNYTKMTRLIKSTFGLQLASAVHHMHQLGIMHCDIGQTNIGFSLSERGQLELKLLDFGLSKLVSEHDDQKSRGGFQMDGMLSFMSPETVRENSMSPPNDCWAMCLVILEIFLEINTPFMEQGLKEPPNVLALSSKIGDLEESPIPASFRQDQTPFGLCLLQILETGLAMEPERRDLETIIRLLEKLVSLSP
jgi:serine/threonine protein kinase